MHTILVIAAGCALLGIFVLPGHWFGGAAALAAFLWRKFS